ncbi:MAG: biopolymer transporter ExbD [Lentisphaeria bacterium]|nr:biopolymer transporter ExbD [Lentisphaeria bacterium]
MARRNFPRSTFDSINVTPLIDTLFFLLIIFMVTAPLLEYTVEVSPPQMNADPMKPDEDSKIVNVKANGDIIFERRVVTGQELVRLLAEIPKTGNPKPVFLRADGDLKFKNVIHVMKLIREGGYPNVLFVTEEEPK